MSKKRVDSPLSVTSANRLTSRLGLTTCKVGRGLIRFSDNRIWLPAPLRREGSRRTYARKAAELEALYERYDDALIAPRQRSSGIKSEPTRMSSTSSVPNTMPANPP